MVARGGVEPPTFRFSVGRSYQLSYLAAACWTGVRTGEQNLTGAIRAHENGARGCFPYADPRFWPPSSSGPGPRPFTAVARVRIPLGVLEHMASDSADPSLERPIQIAQPLRLREPDRAASVNESPATACAPWVILHRPPDPGPTRRPGLG